MATEYEAFNRCASPIWMSDIVLADDHTLVRHALRMMLERTTQHRIVGEAADNNEALELALRHQAAMLILDLGLPGIDIAGLVATLSVRQPGTKTLVLTANTSSAAVSDALAAGADGYVVKSDDVEELLRAIDAVSGGACYVSRALVQSLTLPNVVQRVGTTPQNLKSKAQSNATLTAREIEVLQLIGAGHSSTTIAEQLGLSVRTVRKHRENLMRKLDIHNIAQLTAYGLHAGLLSKPSR